MAVVIGAMTGEVLTAFMKMIIYPTIESIVNFPSFSRHGVWLGNVYYLAYGAFADVVMHFSIKLAVLFSIVILPVHLVTRKCCASRDKGEDMKISDRRRDSESTSTERGV
jgi:large-conductance mechanosensitive channel